MASPLGFKAFPKPKAKPKKKEVAGPYRSQSSVPKIRRKATKHEHRKVKVAPSPPASKSPSKPRKVRRTKNLLKHPIDLGRVATKHTGFDPGAILDTIASVGEGPPSLRAPSNPIKDYVRSSIESDLKTAAESAKRIAEGRGLEPRLPTAKEAQAAADVISVLPASRGAAVAEKALAKAVAAGSDAKLAEKALAKLKTLPKEAKAAPARKVRRIKSAPKRAAQTVKRAPELKTKAGQKAAGKAAAKHPVRSGYGAVAVSPVPLPGELDKRARAAAEGSFNALAHHPGETLKTTARALPAAIVAPAALAASAGASVIHGTPKPLEKTASEQAKGLAEIVSNTFSGDPEKAEMAARKEGSLSLLTPLPAITRLGRYEKARGRVRDVAGSARRKLASKGENANRRVRHAPAGVEQPVFGALGRHEHRQRTALIKQRVDNPHRVAAAKHEKAITDAISKAPKGSHVALQTLAEYGIRDAKGAALVRHRGPGDQQLARALDYVDQHPEVFKSKAFHKALHAVERAATTAPAALVGKGERARLMQQGDLFGHARPEHMVPPKARELTGAKTREDAWKSLQASEADLRAIKRRGRQKLDQAKVLKGAEAKRALNEGKALYAEARELQAHNRKVFNALDPYTRPGQAIDGSTRKPYDEEMLGEYKRQVEGSRREAGLANAIYTHHAEANTAGRGTGLENRFPTNAGRVEHMREGNLAKADNLDRSLEGLIRGTVHLPRMRAAGKQFGRDFVKEFQTPFSIDGKQKTVGQGSQDWTAITAPKTKENPNGGQFDPRSWARFPLREWKNAIKDPYTTEGALLGLLKDAEDGKIKGSEPWILMPREAIKEARAQINPEHNIITTGMNKLARVANRAILGTNPAWAMAQVVAEGIPLLMAKPSLLNPAKLASIERDIVRYRKSHPEEATAIQATAGASPTGGAALRTPLDQQETYTPALWEKGAKALTRGKTARSALSLAKLRALGEFDVRRQNEYRSVLAAAEADRRFRSWHSGLTGLFDSQARLSRRFKTREELWNWLAKDRRGKVELKKIADYVDAVQGNWTAFTRYERALAPFTIFYPFLRYSLRWALWAFPKTHPMRATIAYTLGQANANQLEKLVGGRLENPIAYAFPTYQNEKGETAVLPGGSRISPGQSSITQTLATGNPAAILSSLNPFLGAGIIGTTGVEPFTGEEASLPRGEAAINSLLAMPAPVRLSGGKLGEQSTASKAFEQYDPLKTYRSFLFPFLPQSGAKFAAGEKLSKAFGTKYGEGHIPGPFDSPLVQELLYGKNGKPKPEMLPKVLLEIHKAERASAKVKAAEEPFYGPSSDFTSLQKKLLEAVENAWETGPNGRKKKGSNPYLEALEENTGRNVYLEALKKSSGGNAYLKALE